MGVEEVADKRADEVADELPILHRSADGHRAAAAQGMDAEEMFVDISDDEMEAAHVSSGTISCFGHESSAPFAESPRREPSHGRGGHDIDEGYDGAYSQHRQKSWSTEEERVEDLVYESDEEPPAKRTRTRGVKRRGFGGR